MEKFNYNSTRPKDASTLIIIRKKKQETFVLMGRRSMRARFMPGVYVFPGGVKEKEDLQAYKFFQLKPNKRINKKAVKSYSDTHCQSLLLTAIRETAEETGLYLANERKNSLQPFINNKSTWYHFTENSYIPNINKLHFFGRAITPSIFKTRFHARFFLAFYEDFIGKIKSSRELENLDWISLNEAKNKKIADVTEFMLNELIKLNNNYSNLSNKKTFPMFTWKNNKRWIKWDSIINS